ncbi:PREDICTED: uncharacterized protein LOC107544272 [Miniopterus natalensis]|uniref:uncharacterized protein LOC107544272 n=1 Tax=Miniopterus natalensis TaxID=291302 RepID=UPI0007A72EE1|nr:PREDICTED: uncharacterized protein LOC107544272 [Miniopterus natalensis]
MSDAESDHPPPGHLVGCMTVIHPAGEQTTLFPSWVGIALSAPAPKKTDLAVEENKAQNFLGSLKRQRRQLWDPTWSNTQQGYPQWDPQWDPQSYQQWYPQWDPQWYQQWYQQWYPQWYPQWDPQSYPQWNQQLPNTGSNRRSGPGPGTRQEHSVCHSQTSTCQASGPVVTVSGRCTFCQPRSGCDDLWAQESFSGTQPGLLITEEKPPQRKRGDMWSGCDLNPLSMVSSPLQKFEDDVTYWLNRDRNGHDYYDYHRHYDEDAAIGPRSPDSFRHGASVNYDDY